LSFHRHLLCQKTMRPPLQVGEKSSGIACCEATFLTTGAPVTILIQPCALSCYLIAEPADLRQRGVGASARRLMVVQW